MIRDYRNPQADRNYFSMRDNARIPFLFCYDGKRYENFSGDALSLCKKSSTRTGDVERTELVYSLDVLLITVKLTHYFSHGATEWTVYFENTSARDSAVLSDLHSRLVFEGASPELCGILGDHGGFYAPYSRQLCDGDVQFRSDSGRATHGNFPYFNLMYGDGGVMLAIGWAGTWAAEFSSDGNQTVYTARSVNDLNTYLRPGEKIRTALFVSAYYTARDEQYATNYWRDWFIRHNMPKFDEKNEMHPISTCCLASDTGRPNSDGSISERYDTWRPSMEKMIAEDVKVDFRWFDAGWYIAPDGHSDEERWWSTIGTWTLDPVKWPGKSFLESTEFARANGMRTLMWFEPERVTDPENLEKSFGYQAKWAIRREGVRAISNNIGNEDCYRWTLDRITGTLRDNRVEMYREDNNSDCGGLWKYLDSMEGENRIGITESKFIDAHYRMWDEIIKCTLSFGGCGFVDSCASGGGRNDLESMRRAVPILRSDADRTSTALRLSMTSSFNKWIPFCGANTKEKAGEHDATGGSDPYIWRASYLPALNVDSQFVQDPDQDFGVLRLGLHEWKSLNRYLLKEFYPLTPWHHREDTSGFTSYLFFDPADDTGVLFAFRQETCDGNTLTLMLPHNVTGTYTFRDEDTGEQFTVADGTLTLEFEHARCAKLLRFSVM